MKRGFTCINKYFVLTLLCISCVEQIDLKTETEFESVLVIEATITNEFKQQKVKLSRTFRLEEDIIFEIGASVKLIADENEILFEESEPGIYLSNSEFSAQQNIDYHLEITTSDGKQYGSTVMQLTSETPIGDLYVERGLNENDDEGISIFVDAQDNTGTSKFYRYEYEETYKVIAPLYSPLELTILSNNFPYPQEFLSPFLDANGLNLEELTNFFVDLDLRPEQEQICYNTVVSNHILVTSTEELISDTIDQFRIRFINRNNHIIAHRYSVLVRQFIQSEQAHVFYKTLRDFSGEGNLFSEIQTGFLEGNVFSLADENELVVGYFEVSSVDERRIFFNYSDQFPGEILPPYFVSCSDYFSPVLLEEDFAHNITNSPLIDALTSGMRYYNSNDVETYGSPFGHAPYELVIEECGDCTIYGENNVPDFWED